MDPQATLTALRQPQSLSILSLSEPILNSANKDANSQSQRLSNSSTDQSGTPASLAADLTHYRDLFSKLRFSYVEQVTKERFLRAVVSNPPEFITAEENAQLEAQLVQDKAALKDKKREVREIIEAMEEQGRQLARRYERISNQTIQLSSLPSSIAHLERTIAELQAQQEPQSSDPELCMPLQPTQDLLEQRQQELTSVDLEIQRLQASLPAQRDEVQRLKDELAPIQMRKIKAVEEAQEARRRRAGGGMADELEARGRWLKGVEGTLRGMLEV